MILTMSDCDSSRRQTGKPGGVGCASMVKRVTRAVASLPPSGLIWVMKSTSALGAVELGDHRLLAALRARTETR